MTEPWPDYTSEGGDPVRVRGLNLREAWVTSATSGSDKSPSTCQFVLSRNRCFDQMSALRTAQAIQPLCEISAVDRLGAQIDDLREPQLLQVCHEVGWLKKAYPGFAVAGT